MRDKDAVSRNLETSFLLTIYLYNLPPISPAHVVKLSRPAGLIHSRPDPFCGEKFAENCVVWSVVWTVGRAAYLQGKMDGKCEVTHVSLGRGQTAEYFLS